jgi:hypothetical protein
MWQLSILHTLAVGLPLPPIVTVATVTGYALVNSLRVDIGSLP